MKRNIDRDKSFDFLKTTLKRSFDMKKMRTITGMALIGTMMAGCVTSPFIDESIAKLDANPLSAKFTQPTAAREAIRPLMADALIGGWVSIYTEYLRAEDGRPENPISNQSFPHVDGYKFSADGRYTKSNSRVRGIAGFGVISSTTDTEYGRWSYQGDVLTLNRERGESIMKRGERIISQKRDDNSSTTRMQVEWHADNVFILKDESALDANLLPQSANGYKITVKIDKAGVKTTRLVHVTGVKDGRETGEVFEIATSVRFEKTKEND